MRVGDAVTTPTEESSGRTDRQRGDEPGDGPQPTDPVPRRGWADGVAFAVALLFHGAYEFALGGFADADPWFHGRYADLLWRGETPWHGLEFPFVAHSAFADGPMDWALGWHWLLAPFVGAFGAETGMRAATAVFAAVLTAALYGVLRRCDVRRPAFWTALTLIASPIWVFRLHMGRPTPLVVAGLLLLAYLVLRRRAVAAGVCAFVLMLLYHVPATPLVTAGACLAAILVTKRVVAWRTAVAVLVGIAAAVLVHPGFWSVTESGRATFHVWSLLSESVSQGAAGGVVLQVGDGLNVPVNMPLELRSPRWLDLGREFWGALAATAIAVVFGWRRRSDPFAVAGALLAVGFLYATFQAGRLLEYWVPFAFFGAAMGLGATARANCKLPTQAGALAVVLCVALFAHGALPDGRHDLHGDEVRPAAEALADAAEPGDVVFQGSWDDFAPLFHWNWRVKWLTGMDPWYLVAHDREDFVIHALATGGALDDDGLHNALTDRYGARFVLLWRRMDENLERTSRYDRVEAQLRRVPWAHVLHQDEAAVVFRID